LGESIRYAKQQTEAKYTRRRSLSALRPPIRRCNPNSSRSSPDWTELTQLLFCSRPVYYRPSVFRDVRGETFGLSGARVAIIEYADLRVSLLREYDRTVFPQLLSDYIATGAM